VLLEPTRIYVKPMLQLIGELPVKAMAHVTGGGLVENVPRVMPPGLQAVMHRDAWPMPPLFGWLQHEGAIADNEMHRVFNCGIGLVVVVEAAEAERAQAMLAAAGEQVWKIGEVVERPVQAPAAIVV
jgi:phosphoribosylformylglycinamidine cyclo-ligase